MNEKLGKKSGKTFSILFILLYLPSLFFVSCFCGDGKLKHVFFMLFYFIFLFIAQQTAIRKKNWANSRALNTWTKYKLLKKKKRKSLFISLWLKYTSYLLLSLSWTYIKKKINPPLKEILHLVFLMTNR